GPIPCSCCSRLPVAAMSSLSAWSASLIFLSITASSVISSAASWRRVRPTTSRGRTEARTVRACGAVRCLFAPPATRSSRSAWSRLTVSVRAWPSQSRRSTINRNATVASSTLTWRKPVVRNATTATAVGVDRVGLAALPGREHPRAGGQLRWHVDDVLTVGDQALGHMPADTVAALHRPHPLRVPAAGGEQGPVAVRIGPIAALSEDLLPPVDHLDRRRALVRI